MGGATGNAGLGNVIGYRFLVRGAITVGAPGDNEFGFAPHTDNNFLKFLAQSALPGLEVRTTEDE